MHSDRSIGNPKWGNNGDRPLRRYPQKAPHPAQVQIQVRNRHLTHWVVHLELLYQIYEEQNSIPARLLEGKFRNY